MDLLARFLIYRDNRECILTERLVRDVDVSFDIRRDDRAYVVATRVNQADDQRFAAQGLEREGLPRRVTKGVAAESGAEGGLARRQGRLPVIAFRVRSRRRCPGKDESANKGCSTHDRRRSG